MQDTGPGIPADQLASVFEPFAQAGTSEAAQQGGSGLGLTISRRLARVMDGDITVRSELDHGASFFLWLPAAAPARR